MTQEKLPHRKELCLQSAATSFRGGFLHFLHVSAYALDFYILLCYYFND